MPTPTPPPADAVPLQPIQCACTALKRAARIVGRAYDAGLASAGVSVTQYAILANVQRYAPISQMRHPSPSSPLSRSRSPRIAP